MNAYRFRTATAGAAVAAIVAIIWLAPDLWRQEAVSSYATEAASEQASRAVVSNEISTRWGTNQLNATAYHRAETTAGHRLLISDSVKLNGKTVLRRVTTDRDAAYQFYIDQHQSLMVVDADGDGYFETILCVADKGADLFGFMHSKSGQLHTLDSTSLERFKTQFSLFVDDGSTKGD